MKNHKIQNFKNHKKAAVKIFYDSFFMEGYPKFMQNRLGRVDGYAITLNTAFFT